MGVLSLVSGVCFVAGVVNPPLLRTWGDSVPQSVAAFRGALPFPQVLAFIALGAALLIRTRHTITPIPNPARRRA